MRSVCAWCKKDMNADESREGLVTHSICDACKISVIYKHIPLLDVLENLVQPVLVVDSEGVVDAANGAARDMLGKELENIKGRLGGQVMECAYAKLPMGCGKTEHCTGCAIRNTVMKTFSTGSPQKKVEAYQFIDTPQGKKRMRFFISTEMVGEIVLLRIDEMKEAEHKG